MWFQGVDDRRSWRLDSRIPAALALFPHPPWFLQQCPDSCRRCVAAEGVASSGPTVLPQKRQTVCSCSSLLKHSDGPIWMKTSHRTRDCLRRRRASACSDWKSHPGWFPWNSSWSDASENQLHSDSHNFLPNGPCLHWLRLLSAPLSGTEASHPAPLSWATLPHRSPPVGAATGGGTRWRGRRPWLEGEQMEGRPSFACPAGAWQAW